MTISDTQCPLCNGENNCSIANETKKTETYCWCFDQTIPNEVLDRIPLKQQGRACICYRCASAKTSDQ